MQRILKHTPGDENIRSLTAHPEYKLSETAVAEYDEKGEGFGIAVSGNPFADTAALGEAFYSEEARLFEAERRAILKLVETGDCVIIGR